MSNATTAAALKPTAAAPAFQALVVELFKATPAYIFATALITAFGKTAQR